MTTIKNIFILAGVALAIAIAMAVLSVNTNSAFGSAPAGVSAGFGSATTTVVGPLNAVTIFDGVNSAGIPKRCSSRVISTTDGSGQAIQILFGDPTNGDIASTSLSEFVGNLQSASTTIMYDSGLYGCSRWTAYATASTTLLLTEFD